MKRILSYLALFCFAACSFTACTRDDGSMSGPAGGDNSIRLGISGIERMTRAEDNAVESRVDRLDVLIFDAAGAKKHYERVAAGSVSQGVVTLRAERTDFDADAGYWVYLIANTSYGTEDFEALTTRDGLLGMMQRDENIHMTGLSNVSNAPETFLMDGIAYPKGESEPDTPRTVVLYDGERSSDTELMVTLRRAAAKIVVRIKKGASITFDDYATAAGHGCGYYLRNMPISTSLVAGVQLTAEVATPDKNSAGYFQWGVGDDKTSIDEVRVTAYAYSHDWDNKSALDWEPRLVVNLPMWYHGEPGDSDYNPNKEDANFLERSYYQIPICRPSVKQLERNHYYEVTVEVNAKGAADASEPVDLGPISYSVREWDEQTIDIGGETNRPHYLMVNTDSLEMHNMADDTTTIEFASSSKVTVTVERSWFINKFGEERTLSTGDITVGPDAELSGHIKVHSPVPTNNAPRYIRLKVTNEDGSEARYITVIQYPLVYITNTQGWYSYRSDFGGTTYEEKGANGYVAANYDGGWSYKTSPGITNGSYNFFASKVAYSTNQGKSDIRAYHWNRTQDGYAFAPSTGFTHLNNARMYHIRITASSGDYTLGIPRRDADNYTASDDVVSNNSKVVSPSFLIASQLGATLNASTKNIAERHCEKYVETYVDDEGNTVHLDNWRLPTQYEIGVILGLQPGENENTDDMAVDIVLDGTSYWSASGQVSMSNWHNIVTSNGSNDRRVRCIRDVYDTDDL